MAQPAPPRQQPTVLDRLGTELVAHIASYLAAPLDRRSARLACASLRQAADDAVSRLAPGAGGGSGGAAALLLLAERGARWRRLRALALELDAEACCGGGESGPTAIRLLEAAPRCAGAAAARQLHTRRAPAARPRTCRTRHVTGAAERPPHPSYPAAAHACNPCLRTVPTPLPPPAPFPDIGPRSPACSWQSAPQTCSPPSCAAPPP
jgi:hypothetical protein